MGRWQEAEPTYKRALEIYKQVSGPDHPDVAITYHNLGLLYSSHSSRLQDSEEMYMKGILFFFSPSFGASLSNR